MSKPSQYSRCTTQQRDGSFCDGPSLPDAPFPICLHHAGKLYTFLRSTIERVDRETTLDRMSSNPGEALDAKDALYLSRIETQRERAKFRPEPERVYYVQVGDLIKIGTTTQLARRLANYPPGAKLLATEPGGYVVEGRRHRQFRHLLAERNEWFRPGPELLDHIGALALASR